jgi:N-acetylglutamate synthase-like GNAT family acetyltransferase
MTLTIRPASTNDATAISELVSQSARQFITPEFNQQGANTMLNSLVPQAFLENMTTGFCYWIAEQDGKLVGVIGLKPPNHLFHLFVTAPVHGQGIGRKLWRTLVADLGKQFSDKPGFEVTVNASRYAIPFYRQLGFVSASSEADQSTNQPVKVCKQGVVCYPMRWQSTPTSAKASDNN